MSENAVVDLPGRTFLVAGIDGADAIPGAELTFGVDGRLTGRATVNRVFGPYEVDGDVLVVGPMAATLMAGPPGAMDQESALLARLGVPLAVSRAQDPGDLLLTGEQGTVLLRELDPDAEDLAAGQ
jgi:heat shock protein HslJ